MLARLGQVIYWGACGAAGLALLAAAIVAVNPGNDATYWITVYIVSAIASWLIGRAVLYVLAAR